MQKHFLKFRKVFTNIACSPLILLSTNLELAARYLPNEVEQSMTNLETNNIKKSFFKEVDFKQEKNLFIAENK